MIIKLLTLNIWLGGKMMDEVIDFLSKENADIVLMQEVFNGEDQELDRRFRTMQVLKSSLGYKYSDFAPCYRDFDHTNGMAQRGNGILSKLPITSSEVSYFSVPYNETHRDIPSMYADCPNNLQHVEVEAGEQKLNVFNTHGPWGLDGDDFNVRRQAMDDVIAKKTAGLNNVVLAGDTNATAKNPVITNLKTIFNDVFDGELKTTFNMKQKTNPGYASAVVDYIFVDKNLNIVNKKCPVVDISDHLPLVVELEL